MYVIIKEEFNLDHVNSFEAPPGLFMLQDKLIN